MATTWTFEDGQKRANEIVRYGDTPAMYLAKIIEVVRTGTYLPNDFGRHDPTRYPANAAALAGYAEDIEGLKAWVVEAADLEAAQAQLHADYGDSLGA